MCASRVSRGESPVVGIDPSLTSLGLAGRRMGEPFANALTSKCRGIRRIAELRAIVSRWLEYYSPRLVALEGYALGFRGKSNTIFDLGELGGALKLLILEKGIDILLVPPNNLKLFTTGKGNADKDAVALAVGTVANVQYSTSDQYDAVGLMLLGEAFLEPRILPRDRKHYKRRAVQGCTLIKAVEIDCKI